MCHHGILVIAVKGVSPLKELAILFMTVLSLPGLGINLKNFQPVVVSVNVINQAQNFTI